MFEFDFHFVWSELKNELHKSTFLCSANAADKINNI